MRSAHREVRREQDTETTTASQRYSAHVNPKWVRLLDVLGMQATYTRCEGVDLFTADGRHMLDFLSGYCVYNMGHNHPDIIAELEDELHRHGPTMLQSHVPALAAELAARLCALAGGRLEKVFFTSSGSEGVETVIKFARYHTGRPGILYCHGAFHGLTNGALSLMGDAWWRQGFGPLLPEAEAVLFDDLDELARQLATRKFAAFITEPVQAEAGIRVPAADYLRRAQALCRQYGTLFALDEVQTGLYRTGPFLAAHHYGVDPDMVVLAKALSGGLIPCGAVLMTDVIHRSIYSSLSRAIIHASTFGENNLAMRAGLATLRVMEQARLGARAASMGTRLRQALRRRIGEHELVEDVRGVGLLNGIVFHEPTSFVLSAFFKAFREIHPGMFGQMVVSRLFRGEHVLTQMCGNNPMVLKVAPPLVVNNTELDAFVESVGSVLDEVHAGRAFWVKGLAMIPRAAGI